MCWKIFFLQLKTGGIVKQNSIYTFLHYVNLCICDMEDTWFSQCKIGFYFTLWTPKAVFLRMASVFMSEIKFDLTSKKIFLFFFLFLLYFMNVFIALKGSHFWFLFDFTAAGVVPCGGRKTSPRTSTIVQFIFYFGPLRSAIIFWEIRNKWLV